MTCRRSQVRVLYRAPRVCDILDVTDSFLLYHPEPARPMSKTRSVGAHSICARGGLSCRKRARADMESAPTFFCGGRPPAQRRCPAWSFLPLVESEIRRGAFYMRPRKFILPQAGTGGYGIRPYVFLWRAESPRRGGAPRGVFSLWSKAKSVGAHSICARRSLSYRKRARADMESAPTFFAAGVPLAEGAKGRVFACCACKRIYFRLRLVKNHLMWYTISLQVHRQTRCKPATQSYRGPSGQPVANKKLLFYCRR